MDAPFVCIPDETGKAITLSLGSIVALHSAEPDKSYVIRVIFPDGEEKAIGFSNEGIVALYWLLHEEALAGKFEQGFRKLDSRASEGDNQCQTK